jgi:hypothetical protein
MGQVTEMPVFDVLVNVLFNDDWQPGVVLRSLMAFLIVDVEPRNPEVKGTLRTGHASVSLPGGLVQHIPPGAQDEPG